MCLPLGVPCNVCHGAESIVTLGDGDPGHLVHGQDGGLLLGQHVHQLGVLSWVDEADECGGVLQHLYFVDASGGIETGGSDLEGQSCFICLAHLHIAHQVPSVSDWPTALPPSAPLFRPLLLIISYYTVTNPAEKKPSGIF